MDPALVALAEPLANALPALDRPELAPGADGIKAVVTHDHDR